MCVCLIHWLLRIVFIEQLVFSQLECTEGCQILFDSITHSLITSIQNEHHFILSFFDVIFTLIYDSNEKKGQRRKKHSTIWHLFWFSYDRLMIAYAHSIHFIVNSVGKSVLFLSNILFFWWVHIHFRGEKIVKKPTWTWIGTDGKESSTM